jgi:hypothetical protein
MIRSDAFVLDPVAGIDQRHHRSSPASVALARPGPIDSATSWTVTGDSNDFRAAVRKRDLDHEKPWLIQLVLVLTTNYRKSGRQLLKFP